MQNYTATTLFGLEDVLARELEELGAQNIQKHNRIVSFEGDQELLYRCNLWLRTALRILVPIRHFKVNGEEELYREIRKIDWTRYFNLKKTFAIDAVVNSAHFTHSKYPALKAKDAIADQFREKFHNRRPSVDTDDPDLRLNLHIFQEDCTLSLDSSGRSLHKRGYRMEQVEAPLNEVLAAGMILLTEWDRQSPLVDPMCGSGTIPIEAAMIAMNKAPGLIKPQFTFQKWKDFDEEMWNSLLEESRNRQTGLDPLILAGDKLPKAFSITRDNLERAGIEGVKLVRKPFAHLDPPAESGILVMNPPYGERMEQKDIDDFYTRMGDILKKRWKDYTAWILSANKEALKNVGLRTSSKHLLFNGPLECKFHQFDLY